MSNSHPGGLSVSEANEGHPAVCICAQVSQADPGIPMGGGI